MYKAKKQKEKDNYATLASLYDRELNGDDDSSDSSYSAAPKVKKESFFRKWIRKIRSKKNDKVVDGDSKREKAMIGNAEEKNEEINETEKKGNDPWDDEDYNPMKAVLTPEEDYVHSELPPFWCINVRSKTLKHMTVSQILGIPMIDEKALYAYDDEQSSANASLSDFDMEFKEPIDDQVQQSIQENNDDGPQTQNLKEQEPPKESPIADYFEEVAKEIISTEVKPATYKELAPVFTKPPLPQKKAGLEQKNQNALVLKPVDEKKKLLSSTVSFPLTQARVRERLTIKKPTLATVPETEIVRHNRFIAEWVTGLAKPMTTRYKKKPHFRRVMITEEEIQAFYKQTMGSHKPPFDSLFLALDVAYDFVHYYTDLRLKKLGMIPQNPTAIDKIKKKFKVSQGRKVDPHCRKPRMFLVDTVDGKTFIVICFPPEYNVKGIESLRQ